MKPDRRNLDKIVSSRAKPAVAVVEVVAMTAEEKVAIFAADKVAPFVPIHRVAARPV
jgi:hypothetical protein